MDNKELLQEITKRIDASANETRDYVDTTVRASVEETRKLVETKAEEARASTDTRIREAVGELRVVVEDSQRPIRMIADGHMMLVEKLGELAERMDGVEGRVDRLGTELVALRTEVRSGDAALHEELGAFRTEVRGEFAEVRRVARLENTVGDLAARVGRLEGHAAT